MSRESSSSAIVAALGGSALSSRFPARPLVRIGLGIVFISIVMLLETIEPELNPKPLPPRAHRARKPAADFPANLFPWRRKDSA